MVTGSNSESEKSANKRVNGKLFIDEHAHGALLQECQQSMNNVAVLNVSHLRSCFFSVSTAARTIKHTIRFLMV